MWKTFSNGSAFCRRTVLRVGALWLCTYYHGKVEGGVCIYAETIEVASFDSIIVQSR